MTLEDFEKLLAEDQSVDNGIEARDNYEKGRNHQHRRNHHHRGSREDPEDGHRHKRRRRSEHTGEGDGERRRHRHRHPRKTREDGSSEDGERLKVVGEAMPPVRQDEPNGDPDADPQRNLRRDTWMEAPSAMAIDYTQRGAKKAPEPASSRSAKADFELKIHDNELNKHHLQELADGKEVSEDLVLEDSVHAVDYTFGDAGSQWRMTKLKAIYREATESGQTLEQIAERRFGDLRSFDDAREEQVELERRETYGKGYIGKGKPNGELFEVRKLARDVNNENEEHREDGGPVLYDPQIDVVSSTEPSTKSALLDQTALNRLKARMMKARLRGSKDADNLEEEYSAALASSSSRQEQDVVVLGAMDSRMLAGSREGEVKSVDNKRGRERGLVEENEDMSIEDMVREERRTRGQAGGDGKRFAERIAKDGKFDNNLDYMDENAGKLAKRVQQSEVNLRNTAIGDFQKINRILDNCPLCHHEDTETPPVAPVVSLATRVYLTLPTEPDLTEGGSAIVPIQHRRNLLECDDDEWEEIRNFMKSLTRMYHDQGRDVIFYENSAAPQRKKHATMEVVPLPYSLGELAPAFFREAILSSDEEWTQHKKLIDTLAKSKQSLGKLAFRRSLVKEMPYFHVWFEIDGGLGHIVEDANRWPKGDLFAREIIGGMLDLQADVIKRQGRWHKGSDRRVEGFRKRWDKFDWTKVLTDN